MIEHSARDHILEVLEFLRVLIRDFSLFLDHHEGTITAVATVVIAAFTVALANSTKKLWREARTASRISLRAARAAEKSALAAVKSMTDLERPWLFIERAHVRRREDGREAVIPNYYWISFVCRNAGRAPAVIQEVFVLLADKKTIPTTPDYSGHQIQLSAPATVAVGADFETSEFGPPFQSGASERDVIFYVIYGQLIYKELNGTEHRTGFSVEVSPHMAAASSHPNAAYDFFT